MKGGKNRSIEEFTDFSGGYITKSPPTKLEPKYAIDVLNCYAEGRTLRKRNGTTKVNSTAKVGNGNGIYNYARSATNQWLMGHFANTLYKMDVVGGEWDGTWDTLGADASNGTPFSDSIMHFVTYTGTLIMTTEQRDKPQYIRATDASHFNLEYGGSGTAPQGKYNQVWKEHVWILNIGSGSELSEECASISTWTDNDDGSGVSSQTSFQSNSCFRFNTAAPSMAKRTRDIGTLPDNFEVEVRTYFDTMESAANSNYARMDLDNGVILLEIRWSDDGLEIYDGAAWNEVGIDLVADDVWRTWKFIVTGGTLGTARVDVYRDGTIVGVQIDCSNATGGNDGQIDLIGLNLDSAVDWYLDYLYITSSNAVTDYVTNPWFLTWTGGTDGNPDNWSAFPTQPQLWYKCNDDAANTVVTDDGITATDGTASVNTSILNETGRIGSSFSLTSASGHSIQIDGGAAAIAGDTIGAFSYWIMLGDTAGGTAVLSFTEAAVGTNGKFWISNSDRPGLYVQGSAAGALISVQADTARHVEGTLYHVMWVQDGVSAVLYMNAATVGLDWATEVDKGAWLADAGTVDEGLIGKRLGHAVPSYIDARVDDIRYYPTAPTAEEVAAIYADGLGTEAYATCISESTVKVVGASCAEITISDGTYGRFLQSLTAGSALAGTESILGGWIKTAAAGSYRWKVTDGTSTYDSAVFTAAATAWEYHTHSFTPVSGAGTVNVMLIGLAAGTYYVDQVSIVPKDSGIVSDNSDRIQRSAVSAYNDWDGTNSGTNDIVTPGDIGLTGSFVLNDRMYVTKKWSLHRFTYSGSTPLVDIKEIRRTVGTNSPRSIQNVEVPGMSEVVLFLGTDRQIYMFDGYESNPISDVVSINNGLSSVYTKNINTQALDKVFAVNHSDLGWYELFVPIGSATVPNYSIIYDYRNKSFWAFDNRYFRAGAVSDDGSGQRKVYAQANTLGYACLLNSGNNDIITDANTSADINGYWIGGKVGQNITLSKMDELEVETESVVCTPIFRWRADWDTAWTSKTMSASSNSHNWDPGQIDNYIQFKIEDNSSDNSFKLWSINMAQRVLGGGK